MSVIQQQSSFWKSYTISQFKPGFHTLAGPLVLEYKGGAAFTEICHPRTYGPDPLSSIHCRNQEIDLMPR